MRTKIIIGSACLKLEKQRDLDFLTIDTSIQKPILGKVLTKKQVDWCIKSYLNNSTTGFNPFSVCVLYMLSNGFHEETNYPFKYFNILAHSEIQRLQLQQYMNSYDTERLKQQAILPKQFYHILYQYYMIIENTHWISEEAKAQVQKIHDYEVPAEYFYELRDLINSLPEE